MIKFEEVKKNDIKNLSDLANEVWHEYWVCLLSDEQIEYMIEKFQSENAIKKQIENENYVYFYILKNGEKAGYIGVSKKEDYLFLSKIYVKKEYRHKGLGTKGFEFLKEFSKENDYKRIKLTVNKKNKNSIDAYIKWGFKIVDAVITDIGEGFVMDDYIMEYEG